MKRILSILLIAVSTLAGLLLVTGLARANPPAQPLLQGGAPTVVSYQGQVTVDGSLYDGTGYFKFAIVNQAGDTTYWSNDGTSSGGSQPTSAVQLAVTNGLFNVLLGDTTLPNMTALLATAFDGTDRALRVWFSSDGSSFTQLSPDRRIAAVPYALQAEDVKNAWRLTGNAGTNPATHFLGTTDAMTLTLAVNDAPALRIVPVFRGGDYGWIPNIIGGYSGNDVAPDVWGATIGGGGMSGFPNRVTENAGTVSGGYKNTTSGWASTIGGGMLNTAAGGWWGGATVGGGESNNAGDAYATVSGGRGNTASGAGSVVGGGGYNGSDFAGNTADSPAATVGGGYGNTASGSHATVSGGDSNIASGGRSTVGGGYSNEASGNYASTIAGGYNITATGNSAAVGGGQDNSASGLRATVPGGYQNVAAGNYSLAAGRRAQALHNGSFVWGDATNADVASAGANQFIVRASGGVYLYTDSGLTSGMYLASGGSSWNAVSDRARKENLAPVDQQALLARLAEIPITTWNYTSQDPSIRHIGPMAQDFNGLVEGLGGEGADHINSLDADGVALAAIQRLYQLLQEKDAQISAQQEQIAALDARVTVLERAMQRNPASGQPWAMSLLGAVGIAGLAVVVGVGRQR